jgi:hypothetical protein
MHTLPEGFHAQAEYEFRDPTGTFSYEFSRVYGPPQYGDHRGPICRVDESLSYWSITGHVDGDKDEHSGDSVVDYQRARAACPGHLTFRQFASELHMRRLLPGLLKS